MFEKNETTFADWNKTAEKLPCRIGKQIHVIFCSEGWACSIVGMFTYFNEDFWQWCAYDQQNDKFLEWGQPEPDYWVLMPEPPKS